MARAPENAERGAVVAAICDQLCRNGQCELADSISTVSAVCLGNQVCPWGRDRMVWLLLDSAQHACLQMYLQTRRSPSFSQLCPC